MDSIPSPKESSELTATPDAPARKRPFSVTLLALGVLIITVINLVRFVLSISEWGFLTSRLGISPFYLALTGLIWSMAGSALLWGLWRAKTWAPNLMQAVALTYALYYWLDHIFLMNYPASGAPGAIRALLPVNWRFSAGVTLVLLAYMVWTLSRSKVKAYFGLVESKSDPSLIDGHNQGEIPS